MSILIRPESRKRNIYHVLQLYCYARLILILVFVVIRASSICSCLQTPEDDFWTEAEASEGGKPPKNKLFQEVYTTQNRMVRIYKVNENCCAHALFFVCAFFLLVMFS